MTATAKLSGPMLEALDTFRQNCTAILPTYWIRTGTAVALIRRGLISTERHGQYQLLPAGARRLVIDYSIFVDQAHGQALVENADRVACIVPGCDDVFVSGPRFNHDVERTATQRMRLHVAAAHVPASVIGWVNLSKPLTDEQWETARAYVLGDDEAAEVTPADSGTMVITATGQRKIAEAVARNAIQKHGPIDKTAVLSKRVDSLLHSGTVDEPAPTAEDALLGLVDAMRAGLAVGVGIGLHEELSIQLPRDRVDLLDAWAKYLGGPVVNHGKVNEWRYLAVEGTLRGYPVEVWVADYRHQN